MPREEDSRRLRTPEQHGASTMPRQRDKESQHRASNSHGDAERNSRSPSRIRSRSRRRSRSRSRLRDSSRHVSRDLLITRASIDLREREKYLEEEQRRLKVLEEDIRRGRSQLRESRARQDRDVSNRSCRPSPKDSGADARRSGSPSFSIKDVVQLLNSIKTQSQPSTAGVAHNHSSNNSNHKNILPDFDPSKKGQRVDSWLKKVNECAAVYGWDEKTTIHFSLQKLQGLARTWYESLDSILFTWPEWEQKLSSAFPYEQNYGQSLEDMLARKSRYQEPIEVYYYEKLAMLNQCDIGGKRAVDCLIHGLSDKTMRSSALALRCSEPEQLLKFLMSNKECVGSSERLHAKLKPVIDSSLRNTSSNYRFIPKPNVSSSVNSTLCFNCKERGHPFRMCPKPQIKCTRCLRVGHKVENCTVNIGDRENKQTMVSTPKTMCITADSPNSKFYKNAFINDSSVKAFVDFGSEVCLLTKSESRKLGLQCDSALTPLKGFGNGIVNSIGKVSFNLTIDGVCAHVNCHIVEDQYLDVPLLVGQSYTEQSHVLVYKNANKLQFIDGGSNFPFSQTEISEDNVVKVLSAIDVNIDAQTTPSIVQVCTEPKFDGHILLNGKLIGHPINQYILCGGVYTVKNGLADINITLVSPSVQFYQGMVIGRATKVSVVNRLTETTNEVAVSDGSGSTINENDIRVGDSIDKEQKDKLLRVLNDYKNCFATDLKSLGCTNAAEMRIEVNNTRPVIYRPYRLSQKEREQVRDMVGEMLEAGIVRESSSEYASPIILVRKKDGRIRMCVDYRLLNSMTIKERYPMPVIEDEIAKLSGQAYFVTLDLASGYYQVPISEQSKALTAFVTPDGHYEFNRMPFGLANAPAVFQRMMNRVLGSARYSEATVYIDDVLIYAKNIDECLERLEHILKLLEAANLTLNLSKCEFLKEKIDYLGYEVSASGIRPGDKKVQSVLDFPRPNNAHTVRQFLGLVGYFRKFIKNFARIAYPLNKLLKKDVSWCWDDEQEESFKTLKAQLVNRPILAIYDPAAETELHTDASKLGVGGILMQRSSGCDTFKPVAFYSRQTSPEERNFHAYELETLAVVCSLRKFRVYLMGQNFKIITDCSALRSTFLKRDIIPRIARWWLLLQEFQSTVEYRPGLKMAHVDALSRNPVLEGGDDKTSTLDVLDHYPTVMAITGEDWLHTLQLGDSELSRIRDVLTSDLDSEGLKQIKDGYVIKDNKLYKCVDGDKSDLRWVVPTGARWQLCRLNHDDIGHLGVEKTLDRLRKTYWFPKMARFVKKYVGACIECAYSKKTSSKEGELHPITKVESPFHTVHIDHLGPFVRSKRGNAYILVIVDAFTKFVFVRPVRNTKSLVAIRVLEDIFYTFRIPDRIISDRGTCFTSHAFRKFCLDKGIKHVLNAVASPRSNGQVERYNRTILASLTAQNLNDNETHWDEKVGKIQWGFNNTSHKTTGRTPAEVMFGTSLNSEMTSDKKREKKAS